MFCSIQEDEQIPLPQLEMSAHDRATHAKFGFYVKPQLSRVSMVWRFLFRPITLFYSRRLMMLDAGKMIVQFSLVTL